MNFYQILRVCLPQKDLELVRFWGYLVTTVAMAALLRFFGLQACGCSTALTHAPIFTKFLGYIYPKGSSADSVLGGI